MSNIVSLQIGQNKIRLGDLIDSYHNASNTEGYRVYKDGWCEYWGYTINLTNDAMLEVTLSKHFKLVNIANWHRNTYKDYVGIKVNCAQLTFGAPSTTSGAFSGSNKIKIYQKNSSNASMDVKWEVKGYLTDEEMNKYNL